jgi:hypothetical protein
MLGECAFRCQLFKATEAGKCPEAAIKVLPRKKA